MAHEAIAPSFTQLRTMRGCTPPIGRAWRNTPPITSGAGTSRPVIFIHRQWMASPLVQPAANGPAISNFTARRTGVHKDTPPSPHVVHIVIHRAVLTTRKAGPTFARQESPGSGPRVASGEGGRTGRSGARGYGRAAPVPGGPSQPRRHRVPARQYPASSAHPRSGPPLPGIAGPSPSGSPEPAITGPSPIVGIACHAVVRETSAETRAAAGVAGS